MSQDTPIRKNRLTLVATTCVLMILFFCAWVGEFGALAANNYWPERGKELPCGTELGIAIYRHQIHWCFAAGTALTAIGLMIIRRPRLSLGVTVALSLIWMIISTAALAGLSLPGACLCDEWLQWEHHHHNRPQLP